MNLENAYDLNLENAYDLNAVSSGNGACGFLSKYLEKCDRSRRLPTVFDCILKPVMI